MHKIVQVKRFSRTQQPQKETEMSSGNDANNAIQPQFRSFESQIAYMNGMYQLPLAAFPSFGKAIPWQAKHGTFVVQDKQKQNIPISDVEYVIDRLTQFKKVLQEELDEVDDIVSKLYAQAAGTGSYSEMDCLTDLADWLGDIVVYCTSEAARVGIPLKEVLSIIMASNFSKLDEHGQPIIKDGKFEKGPFYWKPEPKIRELLDQLVTEHFKVKTPISGFQPLVSTENSNDNPET